MSDSVKEEENRLGRISNGGNYVPRRIRFGSSTTTSKPAHQAPKVYKKPEPITKPKTTPTTPFNSTPTYSRPMTTTTTTATTTTPKQQQQHHQPTPKPAPPKQQQQQPVSVSVNVSVNANKSGHSGTRDDPIKGETYNSNTSLDDCLADLKSFTIGQQQKKPQVKLYDTPNNNVSVNANINVTPKTSDANVTTSKASSVNATTPKTSSVNVTASKTSDVNEKPTNEYVIDYNEIAREDKKKDPFKDANMSELSEIMGQLCSMSTTLNNSGCTVSSSKQQQQQQQKTKTHDPKNICGKCGKDVGETYYDIEGKRYHPDCFRCSVCGGHISEYVISREGDIVCVKCDKRMNYVKCKGCHKDVFRPNALEVFGGFYHPECFKCTHCGKPIHNDFLEYEGKPYCTENDNECYKAAACNACATCGKFITGAYTEILGKFYHKDCFKCFRCHKRFETAEYYAVDGNPYCEPCAYEVSK